jgi:predicted transcriptional regulator
LEKGLSFNGKRDRIQIIAEILNICRTPQTKTYIRRQTNLSYGILQSCILRLLERQWLSLTEEDNGQTKLTITGKGLVFLNKWLELQKIVGTKSRRKQIAPATLSQTGEVQG